MKKIEWKLSIGSGYAGKDYLTGILEVPDNAGFFEIIEMAKGVALDEVEITWDWYESEGDGE